MIPVTTTDVLIVGGGIAALRAGVAASDVGASVMLLQKGSPGLGVVGFNAPVPDVGDTPAKFFNDTYTAGQFLSDPNLVAVLTNQAIDQVHFLEHHGLSFKHGDAGYQPKLTSGNSTPRTVYTTDRTGPEIIACLQRLLRRRGVPSHSGKQVVKLLLQDEQVTGALVVDRKRWRLEACLAKAIVLATGGIGPLYAISTNPPDLSGDGYALAYRAGAELIDMEFVQYEPFVMLAPNLPGIFTVSFLLDNQPRIYNAKGEEFLPNQGRGIGKDLLARAIFQEIQAGNGSPRGGVYFDLREVPSEKLREHQRFLAMCRSAGLDPTSDPLEVGPAQHYLMGGIRIDDNGGSTVRGLFAAGEVTGGVHGAGRLAGNSGTDVLVFGARAGLAAGRFTQSQLAPQPRTSEVTDQAQEFLSLGNRESTRLQEFDSVTADLRHVMWQHAGLTRSQGSLAEALQKIQSLQDRVRGIRVRNLECQVRLSEMEHRLLLARVICQTAYRRQESRGVHYRSDFTERDDLDWMKNIVIREVDGKMDTRFMTPCRRFVDVEPI